MTNVRDFIWQRMFSASPISDHHCWWSVLVATEGMIPCYLCLSACCECLHSTHLTHTLMQVSSTRDYFQLLAPRAIAQFSYALREKFGGLINMQAM